jgi:hypothetical protein
MPQDLNDTTKRQGATVNLAYKKTTNFSEGIGDIFLDWFEGKKYSDTLVRTHNGHRATYHRLPGDLNKEAGGKYIYIYITKECPRGKMPIMELDSYIGDKKKPPKLFDGWEYAHWVDSHTPADTNKGAKGNFIYIKFKRRPLIIANEIQERRIG